MMQAKSIWTETDQHLFQKTYNLPESICFSQGLLSSVQSIRFLMPLSGHGFQDNLEGTLNFPKFMEANWAKPD